MAIVDKNGNLSGPLGNIIYRVAYGKNIAQTRSSDLNQSVPSQKSSIEFGLISNTARTLRDVISGVFNWRDGQMGNRMNRAVSKAIRGSESAIINERDFHDGDLDYLVGFQFNDFSPLGNMLKVRPSLRLDESGGLNVKLPPLSLKRDVVSPKSALNIGCSIRVTLFIFNFREEYYQLLEQREADLQTKETTATDWYFDHTIPDGCALLTFMSLGYYIEDVINGRRSINGERLNPVELVGAYQFWQGRAGKDTPTGNSEPTPLPGYKGNTMLRNYQLNKL